jgi:hypothetical protein
MSISSFAPAATTRRRRTRTPRDNPGIPIVPGPEEPGDAQFVPGASNVVPATAAPATDIGTTQNKAQAVTAPFYACSGFSGIEATNPLANLYADKFAWGPYAAYKVGCASPAPPNTVVVPTTATVRQAAARVHAQLMSFDECPSVSG